MESDTISITSKVNTALASAGVVLIMLLFILLVLLMVVISDTIALNSSMKEVHDIASVITNKYGWLLDQPDAQ